MDKRDEKIRERFPKIKTCQFAFGRAAARGRRREGAPPCASSRGPSADAERRARSPGRSPAQPSGRPDEEKRAASRGPRRSPPAARVAACQPPDSPRAHRSPGRPPGAMRPPAPAPCPGRPRWNPWRSFLPLTLALFVGMGRAQRDPAGRFAPAGRDASRLWRPGGGHHATAGAKVYSLFREQDAPVPGSPPAERAQPGWGSPEARRPPRAQQPQRVWPPAQTWRGGRRGQQQPASRARAASALPRFGTLPRPRAAPPAPPRARLTG